MKKVFSLLLAGTMLLSCAACGAETPDNAPAPEQQPPAIEQEEIVLSPAGLRVKELVDQGLYQQAYVALDTLEGEEAAYWKKKLVYLPIVIEPYDLKDNERKTYVYEDGVLAGILFEGQHKAYTHTYTWDENQRLIRKERSYDYDLGKITPNRDGTFTYFDGLMVEQVYEWGYNAQGQLIWESHRWLNEVVETTSYTYNEQGDRLQEQFTWGENGEEVMNDLTEYEYTYDAQGRKTSEKEKDGDTQFTWTYDEAGRITEYTYTDGEVTLRDATTYNAAGKPTEKVYLDGDGITHTTRYTYNEANLPVTEEKIDSEGYAETTTYTYDEENRLIGYSTKDKEREIESEQYTYDEAGRQLSNCRRYYSSGHEAYFTLEYHYTYNEHGQQMTYRRKDRNGVWYDYTYTYDTTLFAADHPLHGLGRLTGEKMTNEYEDQNVVTYDYDGDASYYTTKQYGYRGIVDHYDYAYGKDCEKSETAFLYYFPAGVPDWMATALEWQEEPTDPMKWLQEAYEN